ncbi:stage II sporulation protein R [Diplocloster hominis]|uniref:stage II sporulation protein R n=1 Tax=Diplocloster hominis TaxID=3079010 RepID=UPI0031BB6004
MKLKNNLFVVILSLFLGFTAAFLTAEKTEGAQQIQQGIASQIIRFHVIANSDTDQDQALKLKVKSEIVRYMQSILTDADDINQTRNMIQAHLNDIVLLAETIIQEEGYQYPVTAKLEQAYFPIKTYGDCTFPEGYYEALRVEIGKAQGKNWWCVLYPNLCFVDAAHAVVPEEEKQMLKNVLTEQEYESVTGEPEVRISFKYLTFLNK